MPKQARPKPVCESLESLTGEFADWMREQYGPYMAFLFKKGDDEWVSIERLLFHWTMKVGEVGDYCGYRTRYCYENYATALGAAAIWADANWEGEPIGWHRHPDSGRRRPFGDPEREYVEA